MKRYITILASALAVVACNKDITPETAPAAKVQDGILTVSVAPESNATKAVTGYTTALTYESKINKLQILVFDHADGKLVKYDKATDGKTTQKYEVKPGSYDVLAVVNGPDLTTDQQATLTAARATSFTLAANSTTEATGFVMGGEASAVSVTSETAGTADITVKRFASRVALQKVTNNCPAAYGDIELLNVWVANVVANQTMAGEDAPTTWDNPYSRVSGGSFAVENIISKTGKTADDASLTFKALNKSVATGATYVPEGHPDLLYGFANSTESVFTFDKDNIPTSWTPTKTRIVVEARVNGTVYYYPYDLSQFNARNKANTIEMIISGPGLDDPQDDPNKLTKKDLTVNITVAGWEDGESTEVDY